MPVMDLSTPAVESEFNLDVCVVTDVTRGDTAVPCGTNDGCAPTCASACNSGA